MKKRWRFKAAIAILTALAVLVAGGFLCLTILAKADEEEQQFVAGTDPEEAIESLMDDYEEVSLDEERGIVYVNNELIVVMAEDATLQTAQSLAAEYDLIIVDDSMSQYGIYQMKLEESCELEELEELAEQLARESTVTSASIAPVSLMDEDDVEPVYPDDPWNGASWDTDDPEDENWGVEAVRAPQAWAYFDEMDAVNIGLIDTMVDMEHKDLLVAGAYFSQYDEQTGRWTTQSIDNDDIQEDDHGTHVTGIMAAVWNETGISGLMGNKFNVYYSRACQTRDGVQTNYFDTPYTYVKSISVLLDQDVQAINISMNTSRLIGFAASRGNEEALNYLQLQADLTETLLSRIIQQRRANGQKDFVICVAAGNNNAIPYYKDNSALYGYSSYGEGTPVMGGALAEHNNYLNMIDDPSVSNRIIVVGAVGINQENRDGKYSYAWFSNVGARVDIAAPGVNIYSTVPGGYASFNGTSMATPHVTAGAGLMFATNPQLTGPEVKTILCGSAAGCFYYEGGECGLLDLERSVVNAIASRDETVNRVIGTNQTAGLDLCFLVDTTGSMGDDIDNAQENMLSILDTIGAQTSDYRVAVVDYRDFASRTDGSEDYAAAIQLSFTGDREKIVAAIEDLSLGYGGDTPETVYSGFAKALTLDWRYNSTKVIIVLGDAPPLDPEPITGYTYDDVVSALYNADIAVDTTNSDSRVLGDAEDSLIKIFTIGTDADDEALDFFAAIAEDTGGAMTDVDDASEVSDAIMDSVEMIEVEPRQTVSLNFGEEFSDETVDIYHDGNYQFSIELNRRGKFTLQSMAIDEYEWQIARLGREGTFQVREGKEKAKLEIEDGNLVSLALVLWQRHRTELFLWIEGILVGIILLLVLINLCIQAAHKRRGDATVQSKPTETAAGIPAPRFCRKCGAPLEEGFAFCNKCGNQIR